MTTCRFLTLAMVLSFCVDSLHAQDKPPAGPPRGQSTLEREPPPQAYLDCKGRKAGETVQHSTPEGTVPAVCEETPQGMVARPKSPKPKSPTK